MAKKIDNEEEKSNLEKNFNEAKTYLQIIISKFNSKQLLIIRYQTE